MQPQSWGKAVRESAVGNHFMQETMLRINLLHLSVVLAALSISGCASSTWYEMMENGRVLSCDSLHGQERDECLEQARMSYKQYEQERKQMGRNFRKTD